MGRPAAGFVIRTAAELLCLVRWGIIIGFPGFYFYAAVRLIWVGRGKLHIGEKCRYCFSQPGVFQGSTVLLQDEDRQ